MKKVLDWLQIRMVASLLDVKGNKALKQFFYTQQVIFPNYSHNYNFHQMIGFIPYAHTWTVITLQDQNKALILPKDPLNKEK